MKGDTFSDTFGVNLYGKTSSLNSGLLVNVTK